MSSPHGSAGGNSWNGGEPASSRVRQGMSAGCNRRQFLGRSAQQAAGVAAGMVGLSTAVAAGAPPSERVRIGIIGLRNQGRILTEALARFAQVEIAALCDVDPHQFGGAIKQIQESGGNVPRCEADFRRLLDDATLDAVVVATPDHWHAWMTVLACQAGKDVYLESPATHAWGESRALLEAVRGSRRIVQVGLQERSGAHFHSAIQAVHSGRLGAVRWARAWVVHRRKTIGRKPVQAPPEGVDYRQWLGPAPEREFHPNRFHFNWRWFWDYGGGELAQWGAHLLEVARWGLAVEWPERVSAVGGKYVFEDEQETPDTLSVQYDFGGRSIVWEHRLWSGHGLENRSSGVAFYGDRGTLVVDRGGWKIYDATESLTADSSELLIAHLRNFLDCVRSRETPSADVGVGILSSALCQLGNAAYRLGREISVGNLEEDSAAQEILNPSVRSGWNLAEVARQWSAWT